MASASRSARSYRQCQRGLFDTLLRLALHLLALLGDILRSEHFSRPALWLRTLLLGVRFGFSHEQLT